MYLGGSHIGLSKEQLREALRAQDSEYRAFYEQRRSFQSGRTVELDHYPIGVDLPVPGVVLVRRERIKSLSHFADGV